MSLFAFDVGLARSQLQTFQSFISPAQTMAAMSSWNALTACGHSLASAPLRDAFVLIHGPDGFSQPGKFFWDHNQSSSQALVTLASSLPSRMSIRMPIQSINAEIVVRPIGEPGDLLILSGARYLQFCFDNFENGISNLDNGFQPL